MTKLSVCGIIYEHWGISAVGSAQHWQCWGQGFESPMLHQQKENICLPTNVLFLFIQASGLAYHIINKIVIVSHHAPACIFLRLDDIQPFGLMIYRNKLRMIYKTYALIYLPKCDITLSKWGRADDKK